MDIRKDDTERAVNLLKFYKSKLNKSEEKSLKKAMDKLIETLEAPLFSALLDIQEFYEVSLSTAIPGNQPAPQNIIEDVVPEVKVEVQLESPTRSKKDKKKSRRHQKSEDEKSEEIIAPQVKVKENSPAAQKYKNEPDYTDSRYHQEYEEQPEIAHNENDPWLYFELQLNKGRKGYGFAVAGGYNKPHYEGDNGIFVTKIIPEGAAEVDGQLRIDDVIVSVNDVNLEYVTHEMAVDTLKNAGQSMILIIRRLKDEFISNENANHEETNQNASNAPYSPEHDSYQEEPVENSNFQQFEITLTKRSSGGLGISIQGGYDASNHEEDSYISISKLTAGGVADVDGRLQVGDLILHVDDQSLNGVTHEEAVDILKNTSKTVTLYIARFIPENEEIEPEPEEPIVEKTEKKKKKKHRRDREE